MADPGPFEKRASKLVSSAARFDLAQDLARAVDKLTEEVTQLRAGINLLLTHMGLKK